MPSLINKIMTLLGAALPGRRPVSVLQPFADNPAVRLSLVHDIANERVPPAADSSPLEMAAVCSLLLATRPYPDGEAAMYRLSAGGWLAKFDPGFYKALEDAGRTYARQGRDALALDLLRLGKALAEMQGSPEWAEHFGTQVAGKR
jgi:hypothetical protein